MVGGGEVHLCVCHSMVLGQDVSRGGRQGGGESGGKGEVGCSGGVIKTGRGGGHGEVRGGRGRALWSGCWERSGNDEGGQVREVVEETGGGKEVRGGGVEGEGGSW